MKVDLQITKDGAALLASVYDVTDADSFANACADLWWKLKQQAARTSGTPPRSSSMTACSRISPAHSST